MFFRKKQSVEQLAPPAPPPGVQAQVQQNTVEQLPPLFQPASAIPEITPAPSPPASLEAASVVEENKPELQPLPAQSAIQDAVDSTLDEIKKQLDHIESPAPDKELDDVPAEEHIELSSVLEQFQAELAEVQQTQQWLAKQERVLKAALAATEAAATRTFAPADAEMKALHSRYDAIDKRLDTHEKHITSVLNYLRKLDNELRAKHSSTKH